MDLILNIQRCLSAYGFNPPPVDFWILLHTFTVFTYWHVYPHLFCYPQGLAKNFQNFQKNFKKVPKSFSTFLNKILAQLDFWIFFFWWTAKNKVELSVKYFIWTGQICKKSLKGHSSRRWNHHSWSFMNIHDYWSKYIREWFLYLTFKCIQNYLGHVQTPVILIFEKKRPKLTFSNKTAGYGSLYEAIKAAILI